MLRKLGKIILLLSMTLSVAAGIVFFMQGKVLKTEGEVQAMDKMLREHAIAMLEEEVSSQYTDEMLKVQAVIVRTTLYQEVESLGETLPSQEGAEKEPQDLLWQRRLEKAWDETEGQVVMYEEKLALVPFHQVSNGKTRNGAEVLGTEEYPYLQILECPKDVEAANQITNVFVDVTDIVIESWDSAGYVTEVSVGGEKVSGEVFRGQYGLASSCFEVQAFENQTRILTKGVGHGLGLSQHTANEMTKEGDSYEEILLKFFPGTEIREVAEILWDTE